MPRRKPPSPVIPTSALVASSVRYPGKAARIYTKRQDWQHEAYRHYDICGEARFAAQFFGSAVSRAVLKAAVVDHGLAKEQDSGPVADALAMLFNGDDGQAEMLESFGVHLTIAGECYLVGRSVDGTDVWEVVSCLEIQVTGDTWAINYGDGSPIITLTDSDVVVRIWMPNPARKMEADSPFKSLLPILAEIEWLTMHVFAQIRSRLASAGILLMPQGMTFPPPPESATTPPQTANEADSFMLTLADAMLTPIENQSSPSAVVPIVVTAPDDAIDKPRLLTFWTELDSEAKELRAEAIHRFALGMDLPPEQILGMSSNGGTAGGNSNGVSHWGAWQIEEATIKLHVEPMLDVIVNALTMGYLRVAVETPGAMITYDTSALRLRPDRSKEAFELYDRGLLSVEALIRENGFDAEDLPTEDQFKTWLLVKVASGSATPDQVQAALGALGVDLGVLPVSEGATREARPAPTLDEHPSRPRTPDESALLTACNALAFRALERVGNRLRQNGVKPPNVPSYETHLWIKTNGSTPRLLEDAWSCAPQVLEGIADPATIIPVLNSYCSTLLSEQSAHTKSRLATWLELAK